MSVPTSEEDRWKAWNSFLEATPDTGFMQSSWWADFRIAFGFDYFGVTLKDQGAIVGGALVTKYSYAPQSCFYYVQDGPVVPRDEANASEVFEVVLEVIEKHRKAESRTVSHLRIEPRWQCLPDFVRGFQRRAFPDKYFEARDTLCIDLRPSEEEILAQMKPKGRYNIRVAQRHGVSIVEDTSHQGLADFLRIYKRTAVRQALQAKSPGYFRRLVSMPALAQYVSIFFAEHQGKRLATCLVVYFGRRATYFYGGSLVLRRHVMAAYLLHFEMMRRARARGCEWYDLWGIAPENEPDHPWQNFSAFKRKFGGVEFNLVPTLDHVYDPTAYDHYVAIQRAGTVSKTRLNTTDPSSAPG
jgi:peptidoglycan pentaglycine glycine transferase (the first glycine)